MIELPVGDIVERLHRLKPELRPKYKSVPSQLRKGEVAKEWCVKNRTRRLKWKGAYEKTPHCKELMSVRRHTRRARERAGGTHTAREWELVKIQYGYRCAYCGIKPLCLTKDHVTPLAKNGTNDIANIVPACRHCNSVKHTNEVKPLILPLWPLEYPLEAHLLT